ncbi:MAG: hypothetical protein GY953_12500, partial [bacterium]|nr:hypothetical protein [bacterium]
MRFLTRLAGGSLFFTDDAVVMAAHSSTGEGVIEMRFSGAGALQLRGAGRLAGRSNYLRGNDPSRWRTGVRHYAQLRADDLYPGVSVVFYGNQRRLEYDFLVAPGADPSLIRMRFAGAESIRLPGSGDLVLETPAGPLRQHQPIAYQLTRGGRRNIDASYVLGDDGEVSFHLGEYDHSLPLVVDPVVSFSTFLGGRCVAARFGQRSAP